ncbi:MAG: outer membrane beta-barrel protein [Dinghuibacter sp.]|nr:outer membrane beta-barrel protein [Dinghuibacter sp.]
MFRKEISFSGNETVIDLGTINLSYSTKQLDEVLIIAERPPIIVKKDTVEFNTSSFKTLPNALVEDLLRKLPGVEVDKEGNISVGGKIVNRILVDGRAFFGENYKMATRNLPANMINKIQVTDDPDEINNNSTGDFTNVGKVINLKLKKGVKKGLFGKANVGAGTDNRYESGVIGNIFRDTLQVSVLGFSNNINRSSFTMKDVQELGGYNRSGYQNLYSGKKGGNQGFNLNNVSFGGLESGISENHGVGLNINHAPSEQFNFYIQYLAGITTNDILETSNTEQFILDTLVKTRTNTNFNRKFVTHNVGVGITAKPTPFKDFNAKCTFTTGKLLNDIRSSTANSDNKRGTVSNATGIQAIKNVNSNYSHNISYNLRFKSKAGRSLYFANSLLAKRISGETTSESGNFYIYPFADTLPFNLFRESSVPTLTTNTIVNFTTPLTKKTTLRWNNNYEFIRELQDLNSFTKDPLSGRYNLRVANQSDVLTRTQNRASSTISLSIKGKKHTVILGLTNLFQHVHLINRQNLLNQKNTRFDLLPAFTFIKDQFSIRVNQEILQPQFTNLQAIPEQANLVYVRKGNSGLTPSRRTNANINFFKYYQKSRTVLNLGLNGSSTHNDVTLARNVNDLGVQEIYPVNINQSYFAGANIAYSKEIKKTKYFTLGVTAVTFINYENKDVLLNNRLSAQTLWQFVPRATMRMNFKDKIEIRNEYSLNNENITYPDGAFTNLKNTTSNYENEIVFRWNKKTIFESILFYRKNRIVALGLPAENLLWNVAISRLFLKDNKAQIKFSIYDLLNKNNNFSRFLGQNYITDTESNILKRYFLLSLTYNFNNIGVGKKVGGSESLLLF